ncbi:unnamed protein product [Strongylus vulgaris]|uniref:Uncharacterized protein n=1 Tax=Strongylus vulgaris TaxID=40348 RepID=A0A3P7J1V9_STRVU|nr:unnamed protein product [Strongylus vulgaris]
MPMFHKTGLVPIRLSRDGGQSFPFFGKFYVVVPDRAPAQVSLKDDVDEINNRWSHFVQIDYLAKGIPNTGSYTFKPPSFQRQTLLKNAWQKFTFGFVRVSLSDSEDGVLWSKPTPFPW